MRKESATVQKCKRQMATLGFDSQLAYHRVKLILKIYRDVVWVLSERMEELHEYAWELGDQDADTGLIYLQSFAPDMDLQEFEERVCCVMENRMLVDVIDRALLRLKRYPDRGELYYEILTKQFIHRFNSTEKELLDELNMERSVFYLLIVPLPFWLCCAGTSGRIGDAPTLSRLIPDEKPTKSLLPSDFASAILSTVAGMRKNE